MGEDYESELAKQLGLRGSSGLTSATVRSQLGQHSAKQLQRIVLRYVGLKAGQRGVLLKSVPLVGGGIGAVWNYFELRAIGRRAYAYFGGEALA
jgi:hypothetical protein